VCTALTVIKLLIAPRIPDMSPALTNRTPAIFAIWTVAVLGIGRSAPCACRQTQVT
jgi:hypothetical protein